MYFSGFTFVFGSFLNYLSRIQTSEKSHPSLSVKWIYPYPYISLIYIKLIGTDSWMLFYWSLSLIIKILLLANTYTPYVWYYSKQRMYTDSSFYIWLQSTESLKKLPTIIQMICGRADTWMQGTGPRATALNAYSILPDYMWKVTLRVTEGQQKYVPSYLLLYA